MLFSELITFLKSSNCGLQSYSTTNDTDLIRGASIEEANNNEITFLEIGKSTQDKLLQSKASAILIPHKDELIAIAKKKNISWASLANTRLAFAETLDLLKPKKTPDASIHQSAVIGKNVKLGQHIFIGPNVCIGDNCYIGDKCIIHPGTVIYEQVYLGKDCELHSNCTIHRGTKIGSNCIIHSNAVVGDEGFGFVPTNSGWRKMPQTGIVVLEDYVDIGCSSTIDRPAVGETRIGEGTKIDNLVQIGHGVKTGRACAMASQVGIAGGAKLGDNVILAGQVGVGNRVIVGDRVIASSKCGIHTDIKPGEVISGFPAISNKLWLRCSANFKKLPEIVKALREIGES